MALSVGECLDHIIMRDSVILVDQIQHDLASGHDGLTAIVASAVRRFRPITQTAAAVLALIPLAREVFWGADGASHDGRGDRGYCPDADVPAGTLRPCVRGRSAKWPRSAIGWRLESGFKNAISFPSLSVEEECIHALFDRYEARRPQPHRHVA